MHREAAVDLLAGHGKYASMVAAQNGLIYAAPLNAGNVIQIDRETKSVREIGPVLPRNARVDI